MYWQLDYGIHSGFAGTSSTGEQNNINLLFYARVRQFSYLPDFLCAGKIMVSPVRINPVKTATCPHGMPPGACPVCSGMGGGGGGAKKADFSAKPGEMSWGECYAIGQLIKASQQRAELNKQTIENNSQLVALSAKLATLAASLVARFTNFILPLQNGFIFQTVSQTLSQPVRQIQNLAAQLTDRVAQLISKVINTAQTILLEAVAQFAQIRDKIINIADKILDKLAAIFGEQENAIRKFVSDNFNKLKKKIFSLFAAVDASMEQGEYDEEIEKVEETLRRTLKLKRLQEKINKILISTVSSSDEEAEKISKDG